MAGSLKKFAEAFALGMSATDAAIAAGYPRGKSAKTASKYPLMTEAKIASARPLYCHGVRARICLGLSIVVKRRRRATCIGAALADGQRRGSATGRSPKLAKCRQHLHPLPIEA